MTDYGKLTRDLVADAIMNKIPGLNSLAVFHFLQAQGAYNAVTGRYASTVVDSNPTACVVTRPTMQEVADEEVAALDVKIIVPGKLMPLAIDNTTTVTIGTDLFHVKKVKAVPGGSVLIIFAHRT